MPAHRKELKIGGANLWYLVGLITSDGCLSKDGRHVDITAKNYEFLDNVKRGIGIKNRIGIKNKEGNKKAYRFQISNKNFYDFLLSLGLTPHKSLTLGKIDVRQEYFVDFLRGLIDGDGCIRKWVHPSNGGEQWSIRIYSGSPEFLMWLKNTAESLLKIRGEIYKRSESQRVLKYGKMAAIEIARQCYYKNCLGMERKINLARDCFSSYRGWSKSKTVFN